MRGTSQFMYPRKYVDDDAVSVEDRKIDLSHDAVKDLTMRYSPHLDDNVVDSIHWMSIQAGTG